MATGIIERTALAAVLIAAVALGPRPVGAQTETPLMIARQGYFFVTGQYTPVGNNLAMSGQMFVQYQIPSGPTKPYPVVMVHGGGQTGTNFLGTPDGRPGWNDWFLRQGYAVYIVDQPARGRSAYNAAMQGPVSVPLAHNAERVFTAPETYDLWRQAKLHTQWPGSGQVGDPIFDQFFASQEPSLTNQVLTDEENRDALVALLGRIGPSILLTHSRSGPFGWLVADARPDLVKGIIAVEPSGPPFYDVPPLAPRERLGRPWGLANAPLHFDPPAAQPEALGPTKETEANDQDRDTCWRSTGPARTLPALQTVPVLIVTSEAGYHARYDHCTVEFLEQNGVQPEHVKLGDAGIHGNGHMMMLEKNNLDIAKLMTDWLGRHVP